MKVRFTYLLTIVLIVMACETIYNAELDMISNAITVDARLVAGNWDNAIVITKTRGFNENSYFQNVTGANVRLINDKGTIYQCPEKGKGKGVYLVNFLIDSLRSYKLQIDFDGDTYESEMVSIPGQPHLDTLYSEEVEKVTREGGATSVNDFTKNLGQQCYVDINNNGTPKYYRFYARKILQYYFEFDTLIDMDVQSIMKYGWKSFNPEENFNIAGPADYSLSPDVNKHPIEFFKYREEVLLDSTQTGLGWIYIIHEFGISKPTYGFYKDLTAQLEANGKIFDPMYLQARSNMTCTSNKNKIVMGNFEIASYKEYRYYLRFETNTETQLIKKLDIFYDIPLEGQRSFEPPVFWQQ